MKDITVDRLAPRQRLLAALDEVISEKLNPAHHIDAVESKLFGIGAESYTVGSMSFTGYATSRQTALCLDAGHFHPTEVISDKISAAMLYVPQLLLHVSRPVRWDSDHVVLLDDETRRLPVRLFVTICSTGCISASTSSMPLSTALPRGSLVHAI